MAADSKDVLYFAVEKTSLYFFSGLVDQHFFSAVKKPLFYRRALHKISNSILAAFGYKPHFFLNPIAAVAVHSFYTRDLVRHIRHHERLVLFDGMIGLDLMFYLRARHSESTLIYFWNRISDHSKAYLNFLNPRFFCTYSQEDAKAFGLAFAGDFYHACSSASPKEPQRDFYFLGREKGRTDQLLSFGNSAIRAGFSIDIDLFHDRKEPISPSLINPPSFVHLLSGYMSYSDYLKKALSSRCLLEFQDGNETITLRALESLFYQKKLITNNAKLKSLAFYQSSNIFILDDLSQIDPEKIRAFLDTPYVEIDESIVHYYDFPHFYGRIAEIMSKMRSC
jgi:hypothetical protein